MKHGFPYLAVTALASLAGALVVGPTVSASPPHSLVWSRRKDISNGLTAV